MGNMTKKMADHPAFAPDEHVVEAVYGLGKGMLKAADLAGRRRVGGSGPDYSGEFETAVKGRDGFGFAAEVEGNGVLVLTSRRLLFFRKATVVGRPKTITAEIPAGELRGAAFDRPMLTVSLSDGSMIGLHVPRNQDPEAMAAAIPGRDGSATAPD